jgi:putative endonuclease
MGRQGGNAEDAAVQFLRSNGLEILSRNCRFRVGELDVVARDGEVLVIVEVRMRSSNRFGGAAASVDLRKRTKLRRAAARLLQQHPGLASLRVRFDVIAIDRDRIEWIKHAF